MRDEGRSRKAWPLGVGYQEQAPNHSKLLRLRVVVVSVGVKTPDSSGVGVVWRDERKRTTDDASKSRNRCRNQVRVVSLGPACGLPECCAGGIRRKGGMNLVRALMWNCGNQSSR